MSNIDGNLLKHWGFKPGPWFKEALVRANLMREAGHSDDDIFGVLQGLQPVEIMARTNALSYGNFLEPENDLEQENATAVHAAMDALMRVPTVKRGAVMPDACPAGTIPVGGVVATENAIHPGFHSADICCSMAISVFKRDDDPKRVLDVIQQLTHFGPTKRASHPINTPEAIMSQVSDNPFLQGLENYAKYHFTTQGDGNHFYYVGTLESTGELAIVSHHGSRGLGAKLYERGKAAAKRHTRRVAPRMPKGTEWLDAESAEGRDYWDALQIVREWTKANHRDMHRLIASTLGQKIVAQFWNEHNFVFRGTDGLFYHAKGATPSFRGFAQDDSGMTLIPMNMAQPILITEHASHGNSSNTLGFAPHGAGRNMSRTRFLREHGEDVLMPERIDARFWCGIPDKSELPDAYKNAESVTRSITKHQLANIVDRVLPYGSIMAGDWERDAPWRKGKR